MWYNRSYYDRYESGYVLILGSMRLNPRLSKLSTRSCLFILAVLTTLICTFGVLMPSHHTSPYGSTAASCTSSCQPHAQAELPFHQKTVRKLEREPIPPPSTWVVIVGSLAVLYVARPGRDRNRIFNNRLYLTTSVMRF